MQTLLPVRALALLAAAFFFAPFYSSWSAEPEAPDHAAVATTPETPETADDLPVAPLTEKLLADLKNQTPEAMWASVNRLVRLARAYGNVVTDRLARELDSKDDKLRLVAARALCQLNLTERAAPVLHQLVQKGSSPEVRRMAANSIGLSTALYGDEATAAVLSAALKSESDEETRISIARSLWRIASRNDGRDELLRLMAASRNEEVRDEAALVLAENGFLQLPEVRGRLLNLYAEPTPQGERAFNLLRHYEEGSANEQDKKAKGEQLINEILRAIKTAYPDESKYDLDKLYEQAAKGIVASLDPFSQYMDRDEVRATQEMLQQDYGGIGAYVGVRNGSFIVTSPIYGSPADKAGLRALDVIQEVDGHKANDLMDKGGINGVISKLKGPPGTPVKVQYFRRGFLKPVEVTIVRGRIRVETVYYTLLPADIGYVRLTRFGERSAEEMQAALDALRKQGAKAWVLDLRDNPGGLLRAAVEIADKFLSGGKLIVYSEGNKEFAPRKSYYATGGAEDEAMPMVCLVGAGSASASEIVSGALQDHKRATLVGEKTFGKGSVQQIMPVRATDRETQLRLTIAKYYLPTGRCIHGKGVDVDIEVKPSDLHGWVVEKIIEMRRKNVFEDYMREHWEKHKALFLKLADADNKDPEAWPDFDAFFKKLDTKLDPNDIRKELRGICRRYAQDELKKEFVVDLQEDEVLQRGVLEVLGKMKIDPASLAEYKALPEKFRKKDDAPQRAMLPAAKLPAEKLPAEKEGATP